MDSKTAISGRNQEYIRVYRMCIKKVSIFLRTAIRDAENASGFRDEGVRKISLLSRIMTAVSGQACPVCGDMHPASN
jgi:hypothetical protein